jgi:poly-gamma-glutamate synthesis protein (capsule biosynthesis protein)
LTYNRARVPSSSRPGALPALAAAAIAAACADPSPSSPAAPAAAPAREAAAAAAPPAAPPPITCDPTLPAAACARRPVRRCAGPSDPRRVGEWRYALIAPLVAVRQDLTRDELLAAWRGEAPTTPRPPRSSSAASPLQPPRSSSAASPLRPPRSSSAAQIAIAATPETAAALAPLLGPGKPAALAPGERPRLDAARWAIVPADALVPHWSVISIDGRHPLDAEPDAALTVPLCAPGGAAAAPVRNIDPARVTTLAMTGTTALTRGTARMIERLGLDHPTRDVKAWLRANDLVHISNEVSMVPDCDPHKDVPFTFCSRESYIKILEDSHAKIIELTGSHLTDYGRRWLEHTLDLYRQRGWVWFGGGRNQLEGTAPLVVEHRGNRLGFIGCNAAYTGRVATEGPGPAACDLDRMVWQVGDLRRRGLIPIVAIQHEEVYVHDPPSVIVRDFRRLAEAGAAFVFGSQAHTAHPWEVHHGAFLHYGAGNFYFDQEFRHTAEGVADKLYFHDNRLLTVGRLFTKIEDNGRPRPMTTPERARFLGEMTACLGKLKGASPWGTPRLADERPRPDSFLLGKRQQRLAVTPPERRAEGTAYPLVLDLAGDHRDPAAFVVRPRSRRARLPARFVEAATGFLTAKYPIDPQRVLVHRPQAAKAAAPGGR